MTGYHRPDLTPEQVAREWMDGASIEALADRHGVSTDTIRNRLKKARTEHPDMPWDERKTTRPAPRPDPIKDYITMTDGRSGGSALPYGSVIPSRSIRKRGT